MCQVWLVPHSARELTTGTDGIDSVGRWRGRDDAEVGDSCRPVSSLCNNGDTRSEEGVVKRFGRDRG